MKAGASAVVNRPIHTALKGMFMNLPAKKVSSVRAGLRNVAEAPLKCVREPAIPYAADLTVTKAASVILPKGGIM